MSVHSAPVVAGNRLAYRADAAAGRPAGQAHDAGWWALRESTSRHPRRSRAAQGQRNRAKQAQAADCPPPLAAAGYVGTWITVPALPMAPYTRICRIFVPAGTS
jgi:hypothetical protein